MNDFVGLYLLAEFRPGVPKDSGGLEGVPDGDFLGVRASEVQKQSNAFVFIF